MTTQEYIDLNALLARERFGLSLGGFVVLHYHAWRDCYVAADSGETWDIGGEG